MFVLALTVALVGPYFVNWTSYRADFEREASALLGRQVTVNGQVSARLLPFPAVTFNDVSVAGRTADEPAMRAEQFSMDMELAPFVRGEVLIFDMRLVRPDIRAAVEEDGRLDWALKPETYFGASRVSLEKFSIVEGRLRLLHRPSGREHLVTEINTDISARALSGPWRIDGSMRFDGMKSAVNISTGTASEEGRLRLRLRLQPERYPLTIEGDGGLEMVAGAPRYSGTFQMGLGEAPAAGKAEKQGRNATAPKQPAYRVRGDFALDHTRLDVSEFRMETGPAEDPYAADGSAFLDFAGEPRFGIKADGAQVRLDEAAGVEDGAAGMALDARLAAIHTFLNELPQISMPGSVEVRLPAVVAGDTTIRDIQLNAEPTAEGWKIAGAHASLPGRTTLEGEGVLRTSEALAFHGSMLLAIGQPSGFAAWVSDDVSDAVRRLPAAGFSAEVELSQTAQKFSDLELILGAARFRGGIERVTSGDARPALSLTLDGGRLDVEGMLAFASLFVGPDGAQRLASEDVDLDIKAGPVIAGGLTAETVDAAIRLRQDNVEIDRLLVGGLEGTSISATGSVQTIGQTPMGNIDADIVSVDLAPLARRLAEQYPQQLLFGELVKRADAYPGLFSDARINLVASGADNADGSSGLSLTGKGVAGATQFSLSASTNAYRPGVADFPLNMKVQAQNPDAAVLYALYGLPALPMGLAGEARTEISFNGSPTRGGATSLALRGEGLDLAVNGELVIEGGRPDFKGRGTVRSADLEPWLMTAAMALPGAGLGLPVSLTADLDIGGEVSVISGLAGEIAGSRIGGDLNLAVTDGLPSLSGEINAGAIDLQPLAEAVLGTGVLDARPDGWPNKVFAERASPSALLDIALSADRLALVDDWSLDKARVDLKLDQSGLRLSDMEGAFAEGRLSGLVELRNNGGSGLLSTQLRLEGGSFHQLLPGMELAGSGKASVSATASGKTVEAMAASLAGSGTVSFEGLTVGGMNPDPFAAIIGEADRIGRDIGADAVAAFAPALLRQGRFDVGSGEMAFTIAGGILRAPPLRVETGTASMIADVRADIGARQLNATAAVTYDPGDEQLVGSEPTVRFAAQGPFSAVESSVDTASLSQFLTQRALEIEQRRVEAMQAALLEGQRLRRETRYYAALEDARRVADEKRRRLEEERRQALEQLLRAREAQKAQEEEARRRAAAEAATRLGEAPPLVEQPTIERAPLPLDRPAEPALPSAPDPSTIFSPESLRLDGMARPGGSLSQ